MIVSTVKKAEEVTVGDVVIRHGHAWQVDAVYVNGAQITLAAHAIEHPDLNDINQLGPGYRNAMTLGFLVGADVQVLS